MQIGNYLWNASGNALSYGFRKLDSQAACISRNTSVVMRRILQAEPDSYFSHRYSPYMHETIIWLEKHPGIINLTLNLSLLAGDIVQGEICLDTIAHILQLFIHDKTNPQWNRILTFIHMINIYQIGAGQLSKSKMAYNMIHGFSHVHSICYNSAKITKIKK